MSRLLARLLAHLRLSAEGEDDPSTPPDTPQQEPPETPEDTALEDLLPPSQPGGAAAAPPEPDETPRERALRERLERVERDRDDDRRRAAAPLPVAGRPYVDPADQAEQDQIEAARRAGQPANAIEWMQWQHQSNARIRQAERTAQQAQRSSQDAADASSFQSLIAENPRLKPYAAKVEEHIRANAASGAPPVPRAVVLRLVLGDAMLTAKPKPKAAAKPQTPGNPPAGRVDRGRTPGAGARSDVSGRGARTPESVALRKRLENQPI